MYALGDCDALCARKPGSHAEILDEDPHLLVTIFFCASSQYCRWMQGGQNGRKPRPLLNRAVGLCDFEAGTQQSLRGNCA
jgi:hypothetical protein